MKTSLYKNKTAFDIDGVLVDFCAQVFEKVAKDIGYNISPVGTGYRMEEYYNISSEVVNDIWHAHDLLAKHILCSTPSNLINLIGDNDYILTARGTHGIFKTDTLIRHATLEWLSQHGIKNDVFFLHPDDKVDFCKQLKIKTLYDDKPETIIEALRNNIDVASVKWEYNKHLWDNNKIKWYEYEEVNGA